MMANETPPFTITILTLILLVAMVDCLRIDDQLDINLELIKHQPCTFKPGKSKWDRKLEFEAGDDTTGPKLMPRPSDGSTCYSIGGRVNVFADFRGDFSIYLEMKSSVNKRQVPEVCSGQREDGCGGFGSCLYCNACETLSAIKGIRAQLLHNNRSLSCADSLKPGIYDDIQLAFCLPDVKEILESQGITVEQFKHVYVFDTDVRKLMQTQAKVEQVYRKSKKGVALVREEPLPPEVYWALPFNSLIKEQKQFVACHKIYGNVKIKTV